MNVKSLRVLSCTALLAITACGDNGTEVALGDLTETEAAALAEVVSATVFASASGVPTGAQAAGPQGAPVHYAAGVSGEFPCPLGGTVTMVGEAEFNGDDETGEGEVSLTVTQAHNDCVAESESGILFTLNGAPQISAELLLQVSEDALSLDGAYSGGVDWATDGREGTCPVDIEFDISFGVSSETGSATMAGTVCGLSISRSLNVG